MKPEAPTILSSPITEKGLIHLWKMSEVIKNDQDNSYALCGANGMPFIMKANPLSTAGILGVSSCPACKAVHDKMKATTSDITSD